MTDKELMQQALEALEYAADDTKPEGLYGCECLICKAIPALRDRLAQPEPVTGNLLEDAYNAMVEKKTRSQKLREAGFTRRPKGWEKEKDEQEPVAHTLNCVCGAVWDVRFDGVEEMVHAPTPPQRPWVGLTDEELESMAEQYVTDCYFDTLKYGQAIQSKLKEKNV